MRGKLFFWFGVGWRSGGEGQLQKTFLTLKVKISIIFILISEDLVPMVAQIASSLVFGHEEPLEKSFCGTQECCKAVNHLFHLLDPRGMDLDSDHPSYLKVKTWTRQRNTSELLNDPDLLRLVSSLGEKRSQWGLNSIFAPADLEDLLKMCDNFINGNEEEEAESQIENSEENQSEIEEDDTVLLEDEDDETESQGSEEYANVPVTLPYLPNDLQIQHQNPGMEFFLESSPVFNADLWEDSRGWVDWVEEGRMEYESESDSGESDHVHDTQH